MAEKPFSGFAEATAPYAPPVKLKMGADGRILIPAEMRKAAGMGPNDVILAEVKDGEIRLATSLTRLRQLQAMLAPLAPPGVSIVDEFIAEKRAEAARE